jgi:hypothetical protein
MQVVQAIGDMGCCRRTDCEYVARVAERIIRGAPAIRPSSHGSGRRRREAGEITVVWKGAAKPNANHGLRPRAASFPVRMAGH